MDRVIDILRATDAPDLARMGGKGYALAKLVQAGLPVPDFVVVTPPAGGQLRSASEVDASQFDDVFKESLHRELVRIGADELFAVRSSAIDEDGAQASFAGQLDSFLNIPADAVPEHIIKVWQSAFSERISEYRKTKALSADITLPAVLIQRMVPAESAGVSFSADPVSGRWSTAIVSGVRGLGEELVSGASDAETWEVDRAGSARATATRDTAVLNPKTAAEIAALARRCESYFGVPQDIEWAIHDGLLFLLQSRPITTLGRVADPAGKLNIWDNSNIAESYGGVTTPLTFSFAHYIYKEVYQQFCVMMHVPRSVVEDNRSIFNGMLGLIRGRVYYNLMSWYQALALLPGFRLNYKFMEQMMGVKEGMPASVMAEFEGANMRARIHDGLRLGWAVLGLIKAQLRLPRLIKRFYAEFNEALDSAPDELEKLRPDQLTAHFHHLEQRLLSRWNAPLVNDFFAMVYFGILRSLTQKWCDDEDGTLQNGLLCGTGNIVSAEPARRIREMATLAAKRPNFVELLNNASWSELDRAIIEFAEFGVLYEQYMERFADRCLNELKLESPTLRDDALPLLRSVGSLATRIINGHKPRENTEHAMQEEAERNVCKQLSGKPLRWLLFNYVLGQARHRIRDRENLRFERTRLFGRIRALFMELGKRFQALGALNEARDVLYLELYEIIGYVEGTATTTDLKALVQLRKNEFARFAQETPPADRFETRGAVNVGNAFESSQQNTAAPQTGELLRGIGCCPGVVRGRARVVRNPEGVEILPGEILVAEQTDPGWITLFPAASGVLVQRGSLLSHSAIVSREMGIPSIVSLSGLMDWLKTGDEIEMNGATGEVRRLNNHE